MNLLGLIAVVFMHRLHIRPKIMMRTLENKTHMETWCKNVAVWRHGRRDAKKNQQFVLISFLLQHKIAYCV